jgi:hypothetical protein
MSTTLIDTLSKTGVCCPTDLSIIIITVTDNAVNIEDQVTSRHPFVLKHIRRARSVLYVCMQFILRLT